MLGMELCSSRIDSRSRRANVREITLIAPFCLLISHGTKLSIKVRWQLGKRLVLIPPGKIQHVPKQTLRGGNVAQVLADIEGVQDEAPLAQIVDGNLRVRMIAFAGIKRTADSPHRRL